LSYAHLGSYKNIEAGEGGVNGKTKKWQLIFNDSSSTGLVLKLQRYKFLA